MLSLCAMNEKEAKVVATKVFGKGCKVITPVIGGMMNYSFLVEDKDGKRYILYIPSPSGKEMVIRSLEKESIDIVSSLGITSENVYFDLETGIKANRFIQGHSIDQFPLVEEDYPKIAEIFKKLHASEKLSRSDYPLFTSLEGYEKELFSLTSEVDEKYLIFRDFLYKNKTFLMKFKKALCHNDSQRSNIIKSIDGNFYFIDFEFMMNNDPIYDVAAFGNNEVDEGITLLRHIYPDTTFEQYKRFYLWRIYISLQWYLVALIKNKKDGLSLGINFLDVANHFIANAEKAYFDLNKLIEK